MKLSCFVTLNQADVSVSTSELRLEPDRESIKVLVIGSSRQGVDRVVHQLHLLGFAEFGEWSRLLPAPTPGEVMRILVREVALG